MTPVTSMTSVTSTLYLVRHGESTWNVAGRVQGQADAARLTARGREQVRAAAARLAGVGARRLVTSDLARARETADIVGAATGLDPWPTPLLREMDLGRWQGLPSDEAAARWADLAADDPWTPDDRRRPPGGESTADVRARVAALLASPLVTEVDGAVVLVSHGDTIRVAVSYLLGEVPAEPEVAEDAEDADEGGWSRGGAADPDDVDQDGASRRRAPVAQWRPVPNGSVQILERAADGTVQHREWAPAL
ncbi:histidine phosphatase family protein [Nakamurella endophytica]|uniref:Phosphoglycerate mutase n=1 Tax=Nakamurella endophytica TaxID=1748367 RepID=A0A917SLS7_9ACTN|nr:histidine phosphatase family protein [Nakamurella endophytica]GGL85211.1 hypothetical protein GCM10011594_01070 [Nakamurella endophytica]